MERFSIQDFKTPPKSARPLARWWWTGLDVVPEELVREIEEMDRKGLYGCEIQTLLSTMDPDFRTREPDRFRREHRYGTKYYFDMVKTVLEECRSRGMIVDLTVGSAWPIGGTDVAPEKNTKTLILGTVTVDGGGSRRVGLPTAVESADAYFATMHLHLPPFIPQYGDREELKASLRLIGVTAAKPVGEPGGFSWSDGRTTLLDASTAVDLTVHVRDGSLEWTFPEGVWQVFAVYAGPAHTIVNLDSKKNPDGKSLVLDHFSDGLVEEYLDRIFDEPQWGPYYGNTLRSFFSDSFELDSQCFWTDDFPREFKRRRGYDIMPFIEAVFVPDRDNRLVLLDALRPCFDFPNGVGSCIRRDYERTIAELFDENMLRALKRWGDARGLKSKVQCYGLALDNVQAFGSTHIPETEQLASHGSIDFMKLAGSAGILHDKPIVSAECLVWPDQDYKVTPMKMKVACDRVFIAGVNQMIYHGWSYQNPEAEWPGSYPFHGLVGTFMARNDAMWPWLGDVNAYVARGQLLMQRGRACIDVAFLNVNLKHEHEGEAEELGTGLLNGFEPEKPAACHAGMPAEEQAEPQEETHAVKRPRSEWAQMAEYSRIAGNALMERGYDYMHINEACLAAATLQDGVLRFGGAVLKALVLPRVERVNLETAVKLRALMDAGFPVFCVDLVPGEVPGWKDHERLSARVRQLLSVASAIPLESVPDALEGAGVQPGIRFGAEGLQHVHRRFDGVDLYFVRSRLPEARLANLSFPHPGSSVRVLDSWTGRAASGRPIETGGRLQISLPFVPYGSHFILIGPEAALPASDDGRWLDEMSASVAGNSLMALDEGWKLTLRSSIPSDEGRTVIRRSCRVGDWAHDEMLGKMSGTGTYERTFIMPEKPDERIFLDLGIVGDVAEVELNGVTLPTRVTCPYALEVGGLLKAGENRLVVNVVNTLRNGLTGSGAFRDRIFGGPDRTRAMSGIIGPVSLKRLNPPEGR